MTRSEEAPVLVRLLFRGCLCVNKSQHVCLLCHYIIVSYTTLASWHLILRFTPIQSVVMPSTDCLAWQAIDDACMDIIDLLQKAPNSDSVLQGSEPSLATRSNVPDLHLEEKARRMIENMNIAKGSWSGRQAYLSVLQAHLERLATDVQSNFKKQWIERLSYSQISSMTQEAVITIHIKRFEEEMNHCRQLLEGSFLNESPMEDSATIGHEWTTEARSLMEHVYQKLPRLEQHEKKTLAEVSGLSLRQITIWVRPFSQLSIKTLPIAFSQHSCKSRMLLTTMHQPHERSSHHLSQLFLCLIPLRRAFVRAL